MALPAACSPAGPARGLAPPAADRRLPRLADMVLVPAEARGRSPALAPSAPGSREEDLLVDRFEITDGEFAEFLQATRYAPADPAGFLSHWRRRDGRLVPPPASDQDLPVRHVSLEDARAYAHWREKEVPSFDEWLRACPSLRDGALPWRGRAFAGACNSLLSRIDAPMPVGSYELGRTQAGCYDVIGNVREWTSTDSGIEKAFVLGGSFRRRCSPRDPEQQGRLDPWLEEVPFGARADDLGFRCVIRGAGDVLEQAFSAVQLLSGAARSEAIAELLRVGEWTYGRNQLLPFVRAHAFARRLRFDVELTQGEAAPLRGERPRLLGPPPAAREGRGGAPDALFVAGQSAVLRLSAKDGRVLERVESPLPQGALQRSWVLSPGGAPALLAEGRQGELALLEVKTGRALRAGPAPQGREVVKRWLAGGRGERILHVVQQLDVLRDADGAAIQGDAPCARVVSFAADRAVEAVLTGEALIAPPPAGDEGLLLVLHHKVDAALPVAGFRQDPVAAGAAWRAGAALALDFASLELLRGADLARSPRWFVAGEARRASAPLPPSTAVELRWVHWTFAPEREGIGERVELDAPEDVPSLLLSIARPASCLVDAGAGRFWLIEARGEDIRPPRPLEAPGALAAGFRLLPAEADRPSSPFLLSLDGGSLWRVRDDRAELEPVASGLAIPSELSWSGFDAAESRLVVRTRSGRWLGVDLERGRPAFALDLPDQAAIHPELLDAGGESVLACQTTATSAWLRSAEDGRLLDEFGVARPSIDQVRVERGAGGAVEPLVLFDDGRLVALGTPERESARLLADFLSAARPDGDAFARAAGRQER